MKGGRVFQMMGIKEGGERVSNVTRIITLLDDDFTVYGEEVVYILVVLQLCLFV